MPEQSTEQQSKDAIREFRRIVADAVNFVRSQEIARSFASISLEELVDDQIALIEETSSSNRPSKIDRVDKIKEDLDKNIEAIKNISPDDFRRRDNDTDVNTDRDVEE